MSGLAGRSAFPDAGDVAERLNQRIASLAPQLLGAGVRRGNYWTVGSVGNEKGASLWIYLGGPRQGHWRDAATGEFGDALDLVATVLHRGDKKAAYRWAIAWLGGNFCGTGAPVRSAASEARDADAEERKRRAALRMWLEAQPSLAGTPAAAYLAGRGIDLAALRRQPRALRFHPSLPHRDSDQRFPAIVAAISNLDGAHVATHRTWLAPVGCGWGKAPVAHPKMTLGTLWTGAIRIWRGATARRLPDADADAPVVIGEGIETCLSIALAVPELRVLCATNLPNMGAIALPPQVRSVILAADNDAKPAARRAFQAVVDAHLAAGREVRIARADVGNDFNDALRAWG